MGVFTHTDRNLLFDSSRFKRNCFSSVENARGVVEIHLSLRSLGPDAIAGIVSHGAAQIMSRELPHPWGGSKNYLDGNLGQVTHDYPLI
jgi:hypothetical protein